MESIKNIELEDGDRFIHQVSETCVSFDSLCAKIKDNQFLDPDVEFVMFTAPPVMVITDIQQMI